MAETKEELTARLERALEENAELRQRVQELERDAATRPVGTRPAPVRASFNLSQGTRAELEAHRDDPDYVTRDPFTGETLTPADLDRLEGGNRPADAAE